MRHRIFARLRPFRCPYCESRDTFTPSNILTMLSQIEIIRCHTRRLLSSIYNASSHRRSPIPPSRSPDSPHCRRGINDISVFLYNCEKLIRDFLGKAVIRDMFGTAWICNPSDVQGLRRSLQERLESLVLSLCYDQQPRNGTGDPIQETHCHVHKIGTVVEDMLRCLSLYHLKTVPRQIPRGSLAALGQPVIFSEASPNESLIPIPHFFCDSKQKLHNLMRILFQNRPWHAKIDQEEYVLEDKEQTTVIGTENWRNIVVPGALIHMIMIVKYKGAVSDSRCPSCHAINIEKICQGKKLKCLNCKLISDVAETNRIVELSDENTDSSKGTFSRIRYIREQRTNARLVSEPNLS
ncbi:hypothetical protein K469DRAFT_375620 [Zopfia rhizophila CBS 207.26]|uniref:Ubiquitin-like domain-containing protein n=1 Tax=Zopfia rhizophila CBS 207.26 TaxID=1314779 RepID=A0A6A6DG44_9PEZI|nr:hypothetical protein K469DRAFT_375620 [Zopfia rhizophila CBS 207.26]